MWDWFKRLCSAPQTLTPLPGAAPFKRPPQQLAAGPAPGADAAKQRDQDAVPYGSGRGGSSGEGGSGGDQAATPLLLTPICSTAATAGTPARTPTAMQPPDVFSRTPPAARTPDARPPAAGATADAGGAAAAEREPSPFTPQHHITGTGVGPSGAQAEGGTPGRGSRAPSAPPCTGASGVSTGRFKIEGGKPVGIPNTVSKYAPSQPLMQHVTPFERRVERKLAEEEEEMVRLRLEQGQQ